MNERENKRRQEEKKKRMKEGTNERRNYWKGNEGIK